MSDSAISAIQKITLKHLTSLAKVYLTSEASMVSAEPSYPRNDVDVES